MTPDPLTPSPDKAPEPQIRKNMLTCPYCEKERSDCPEKEYGTETCEHCGAKFYFESDVVYNSWAKL